MPGKSTEKIQVRVDSDVAQYLAKMSIKSGQPLTAIGGVLLEKAVYAEMRGETDNLLYPEIRRVVQSELRKFQQSQLDLLLRMYLEAGTARRLVQTLLTQIGIDRQKILDNRDEVSRSQQVNWESTLDQLYKELEGVEQWLASVQKEDE